MPTSQSRVVNPEPLEPSTVLGMFADPVRLRVLAALALGATTVSAVVTATGLAPSDAQRALDRLLGAGVVEVAGEGRGLLVAQQRLVATARSAVEARPRRDPTPGDATAEQADVLRNFVVGGRLTSIPVARAKRRVVLDYLSGRFEPGRVYPEPEVNLILGRVFDDYAALRRYLVDEGFMERRDGFYWRAGGTFDTE
jgi:hypothetical protein